MSVFKIGEKVDIVPGTQYHHQKARWGSRYTVVKEAYISRNTGRQWYRTVSPTGYSNSYPEIDLISAEMHTNREASKLLSKEW